MTKMKKRNTAKPSFNPNSRKALRKQKRQEKKVHRKEHYLKKKTNKETYHPQETPGRFVKRPEQATDSGIEPKKKKPRQEGNAQSIIERQRKKEQTDTMRLKAQMDDQRKKMLVQANDDEDKIIKKLEKQLGLNKSKNKNNYFADDGLDYLLEICDRSTSEQIVAAEKHLANVEDESDFEEDLATVTGKELDNKETKNKSKSDKKQSDDSEIDDNGEDDDLNSDEIDEDMGDSEDDLGSEFDDGDSESDNEEPEEKPTKTLKSNSKKQETNKIESKNNSKNSKKERVVSENDLSKVFSDDEVSHLSDDDEIDGLSSDDDKQGEANVKEVKEKPDIWEDIYGRKRDKEGNIIKEEKGVYVPPHLRNKDSSSDKDLIQLKRQVKSVINKLAGTNLHWACNSIEALYSNHSRHSVNSSLLGIFLDAVVGTSMTPDRMVAEHAALVAVLHANVGGEVGAHFLEELTRQFDNLMSTPQPVENKTLDNLVACLAYLYHFKIYQAQLLYDILHRLLLSLTEKNIECILVALRCVGGVMRKEEPLMLKGFVADVQKEAGAVQGVATGSRIKFLLEVVLAVKNNNLNKIPNYDPTYSEDLRKHIRSVIRKGNYITTLNIRLEDLLKAEERGKWWVVGSAWEGNRPLPDNKQQATGVTSHDHKLLELARKQRMNTDVRRSVFCVIMSAEDYMDAFEKLQHLGLKGQQEREIIHVLLACCLQEKTYNPYYAVLGQKLCDFDRKYQLSIQYTVWDKIKEIEELPKHNITNLAQFLTHLIMEKGLPISVLKVIQFSDLNKHTVKFMRQILLAIIMNTDLQASLEVFYRIAKPPKLHMFRESLRLFVQHFLVKNAGKKTSVLSEDEMATLKDRAFEVDKILTMYENKLRL